MEALLAMGYESVISTTSREMKIEAVPCAFWVRNAFMVFDSTGRDRLLLVLGNRQESSRHGPLSARWEAWIVPEGEDPGSFFDGKVVFGLSENLREAVITLARELQEEAAKG